MSDHTGIDVEQIGKQSLKSLRQARGKPDPDYLKESAAERDEHGNWFVSVYSTPFQELSDEDLTIFCQQKWESEYTVPVALLRLQHNPFVGRYCDGDLVEALGDLSPEFWKDHPAYKAAFLEVLTDFLRIVASADADRFIEAFPAVSIDEDTYRKVAGIYSRLSNS